MLLQVNGLQEDVEPGKKIRQLPGFAAGTGGAFIILLFYRLLAGNFFVEAEDGERTMYRATRSRRRRLLREG